MNHIIGNGKVRNAAGRAISFKKVGIIVLTLSVQLLATSSWSRELLPATIVVDELKVVRENPRLLFGFNHNWIQSERIAWDKEKNEISAEFLRTLFGLSMPLNRMSGAASQIFHWKQAIGAYGERTEQQLALYDNRVKKSFGPLEWINSTRKIDPAAKFSWVFNMKTENLADHVDLVEFLTGDGDTNPNGGINWAQKRIRLGLKEPLKECVWELGNELDYEGKSGHSWALETYIQRCKAIIEAVRGVEPGAIIAVHAATAPWSRKYFGRDWREWHRRVLLELGDSIDFISFHPYYLGKPTAEIERYLDVIRDDILSITGNDRIKIYISEHAVWPSRPLLPGRKWSSNWYQTHSLAGCLGTAQFLNRILSRPEITAAAYHSLSAGPWGLIYRGKLSGKLYITGIYSLYRLFSETTGDLIVASTVTGKFTDTSSKKLNFTISASTTPGMLKIIAVNRDDFFSRKAKFKFTKKYRLLSITTLTAKMLNSYNSEDKEEIIMATMEVSDKTTFEYYVIPPKSIYAFTLESLH